MGYARACTLKRQSIINTFREEARLGIQKKSAKNFLDVAPASLPALTLAGRAEREAPRGASREGGRR